MGRRIDEAGGSRRKKLESWRSIGQLPVGETTYYTSNMNTERNGLEEETSLVFNRKCWAEQ